MGVVEVDDVVPDNGTHSLPFLDFHQNVTLSRRSLIPTVLFSSSGTNKGRRGSAAGVEQRDRRV